MAQNTGGDKTEPSLELPSLKLPGLGRRRRKASEPSPEPETLREADRRPEPKSPAEPEPATEDRTEHLPPEEPTEQLPTVVAREDRTEPDQFPATEERTEQLPPATEERPTEGPQHRQEPEPAANGAPPAPAGATVADRAEAPSERTAAAPAQPQEEEPATRRGFSLPALAGPVAAAVTGVVVGVAGAVATYAALAGCELVRGVSSCGGAPGFFILLAILVLLVLLGSAVLAGFKARHPGSTSFLAVGIVTVVVMLFLLEHVASAWMIPVVIALFAAAYLVAHWVSTRFADEDTGRRDWR